MAEGRSNGQNRKRRKTKLYYYYYCCYYDSVTHRIYPSASCVQEANSISRDVDNLGQLLEY
jgi:hypothetical protein